MIEEPGQTRTDGSHKRIGRLYTDVPGSKKRRPDRRVDIAKIAAAVTKAFDAVEKQYHPSIIDMLALKVTADFEPKIKKRPHQVEEIQDSVESVLVQAGYGDVAKAYILYKKNREKIRNLNSTMLNYKEIVDNYVNINDWRVKENSTVTYSVGGLILSNSGAITANYCSPRSTMRRSGRHTGTRISTSTTCPC